MNFSERFKKFRVQKGLSQENLGEKVGVKQKTISNWESGRNEPPLDVLKTISKEWNINLNWLIIGQGDMFIENPLSNTDKGLNINGNNNITNSITNSHIMINKNDFNDGEDIEEAINLLKKMPKDFLQNIIGKMKDITKIIDSIR